MSFFRPLASRSWRCTAGGRIPQLRCISHDVVTEGDIVLLKNVKNRVSQPVLTSALAPGKTVKLQFDSIAHDDILGKPVAEGLVLSKKKKAQFRIHRPTLAEYTDNSPRIVTPIYSQDANLIVSLLDLHPTLPGTSDAKLEIFEAGTGHGALTLFLARAIHAANTAAPKLPNEENDTVTAEEYTKWLAARRAVVHTLDISERHSRHARKVINGFRGGMYFGNIDFHVGTIEDYLKPRLGLEQSFLDHAILDLPNTHLNMDIVGQALKPNGTMITFCPSITQIAANLDFAKAEKLPLFLESVVEIGSSVGTGGREWDVRRVQVRAQESTIQSSTTGEAESQENVGAEVLDKTGDRLHGLEPPLDERRWEMVCRPMVGTRVVGGGFVALWRKKV